MGLYYYSTVFIIQIMNDKKFESLRKKLDNLGFTQTMNPDTFELVNKLYDSYFKTLTELAEVKKEMTKMKNSSSVSINSEDYINELIEDKQKLKRQIDEMKSGNLLKQKDDLFKKLSKQLNQFKIKAEESNLGYQRQIKGLASQNASLEIKIQKLEKDNRQLRNMSSANSTQSQRYSAELTTLIEKKGRQIRQLEDANGKLRIRVQVLERNIEDAKFSKKEGSDKPESDKLHNILKQQLNESENRVSQLKNQLESTRDEVDDLRRDLRRSREEILILKQEESNTRNLQNIGRVGKQKIELLYEETRQQLHEKSDDLKRIKDDYEEEQKQKGKLEIKVKELFNKTKFLTQQNSDLQTQIEHISSKSIVQVKRVRELESINASLEKQLHEEQNSDFVQTRDRTRQELENYETKAEQLRKEVVVKDRQIKLFEDELKVLKEQGEKRTIERDKALMELKKLQVIASEGSRNIQSLQLQKEQLMKENSELRNGKMMLTSVDQNSKSQIFIMRQKLQDSQSQIDQLRSILHSEQLRIRDLDTQILRLQNIAAKSEDKNKQIFDDNKMMVGQIKLLEHKKNQLQDKVKELQERTHLQSQGHHEYKKEMNELIAQNNQLEHQLQRKDQALRRLDCQKDELQNQLDKQTQEKSKLRDHLHAIETDMRQYNRSVDQKDHRINDLERVLSKKESENQDLLRQHDRSVERNIELEQKLNSCEVQLRQVKDEVKLVVFSNQEAQKEAERGKNKVADLDRKLKDRTRQSQEQRERATAMTILSNELQAQLERERAEIVRLKGFVEQLEDANNQMYQQLERKDHEIDQLTRYADDSLRKEEQFLFQINSYQKQLQNYAKDNEQMLDQIRRLSGEKQYLRSQRNWKKQVNTLTQDWRTKQEERFIDLQRDYNSAKMEIQQLKIHIRELEHLLDEQRRKNIRMEQHLGTPTRPVLVESRVECYHESENYNNSNVYQRSRHQSVPSISDMSQESSNSEMVQQTLMEIEKKYLQASELKVGKMGKARYD